MQDIEVDKASLSRQLGQEQADHRRTKETNLVEASRLKETVDSLKSQLGTKERVLQDTEAAKVNLTRNLNQEQTDHRRTKDSLNMEISRVKKVNEALQRSHQEEITSLRAEYRANEVELQKQLEVTRKTAEQEAERFRRRSDAEKADFKATISRLEVELMKANKAKTGAEAKAKELETKLKTSEDKLGDAEKRLEASSHEVKSIREEMEAQLKGKDEEKAAIQNELDDLLMVFGDLEDKAERYKVSKPLRQKSYYSVTLQAPVPVRMDGIARSS